MNEYILLLATFLLLFFSLAECIITQRSSQRVLANDIRVLYMVCPTITDAGYYV